MRKTSESRAGIEKALELLLQHGTYLASAVIAAGLALMLASNPAGMRIATAGIVLFILLPVARVSAMLIFFLRAREYRLGAAAALVMSIVLLSYLFGAR
jgi:uncharacterized membrane protein